MEYTYRESLPKGCPLPEAVHPEGLTVFRLHAQEKFCDSDLDSYVKLHSGKAMKGINECVQFGVSVWETEAHASDVLASGRKNRWKFVSELRLCKGSGMILHTKHGNPQPTSRHLTWWVAQPICYEIVQTLPLPTQKEKDNETHKT